jgi:predicted esterase/HEAT repeat protein
VILVPAGAAEDVDWEAVFRHELAHRRRRDHVTSLMAEVLACLWPWQPLAWWVRRRIGALSERACDDWAVVGGGAARYARALVGFAAGGGARLALPAVSDSRSVGTRVKRILMGGVRDPRAGRVFAAACAAGAIGLASVAALARPRAQPTVDETANWAERFGALTDWRSAFNLGQQVAALPPDQGWAVIKEQWPRLSVASKQQMLKAWVYKMPFPLTARMHPRTLEVLDLGMRDASPDVQKWSVDYLPQISLVRLEAGSPEYERWWQQNHGRKLADVMATGVKDLTARLRTDEPAARKKDLELLPRSWVQGAPAVRAAATEAGLPQLLQEIVQAGTMGWAEEEAAAAAVAAVGALDLGEAYERLVLLPLVRDPKLGGSLRARAVDALGRPGNSWAEDELIGAMRDLVTSPRDFQSVGWSLAGALAKMKSQRAIPTMIAVIGSDNTYNTVYGVGYFGLTPLTGVKYDEVHTGPWWKAWWEKNKAKYPGAGEMPELARAGSYQASDYDTLSNLGEPGNPPTDELISIAIKRFKADGAGHDLWSIAQRLGEQKDSKAIPTLIAMIEADNTYDTVYGIGYSGLAPLTGVKYDEIHTGPWWRAWWEKNKSTYPGAGDIPVFPKTKAYKPSDYDTLPHLGEVRTETGEEVLPRLKAALEAGDTSKAFAAGQKLGETGDQTLIPTLIAYIAANDRYESVYGVGYFALGPLTGVKYDDQHNGAWWKEWWDKNKAALPENVRTLEIPKVELKAPPLKLATAVENGRAFRGAGQVSDLQVLSDGDAPTQDLKAGGDEKKRYFLMGPKQGAAEPADGYRLLVVLPGGDGSDQFRPWVSTIEKEALPDGFVLAELVAPKWRDDENRIVWPTRGSPDDTMAFPVEDFIEAVVADVKGKMKIDARRVYALAWSSSGPAVYAAMFQEKTGLTGALIAMSVFHPESCPPAANAKGRPFYLLHSPQDFIPMKFPEAAKAALVAAGCPVKLETYEGGHGWHGDPHAMIRAGVEWLETQIK